MLYRTGPKSEVVKECMYERINERERPRDVYEGEGWIGPEASSRASYILLILSARNKQPERGKGTGCKTYLSTIKQMDLKKLLCIARCGCCGIGKELVATYLTARQAPDLAPSRWFTSIPRVHRRATRENVTSDVAHEACTGSPAAGGHLVSTSRKPQV